MNKKQKTILTIALGTLGMVMLVIGMALAVTLYEGESYELNMNFDDIISWQVIGNDSYVNATQITNHSILITIPSIASSMNFTIEAKGYKDEEEKVSYVYVGGGSHSKSRVEYRNVTQIIFESSYPRQ